MFTGIVTDVGRLRTVEKRGDTRFVIETGFDVAALNVGASVACAGVCLTVVAVLDGAFAVDVSAETLSRTTLGGWRQGTAVNLERALRVGDELGGHITTGHVDAVAAVLSVVPDGESLRMEFEVPGSLAGFIAEKGSVCVDGVSLTVNAVKGARFGVNIIPHTREHTTLGALAPGATANVEIDVLARYVARLAEVA